MTFLGRFWLFRFYFLETDKFWYFLLMFNLRIFSVFLKIIILPCKKLNTIKYYFFTSEFLISRVLWIIKFSTSVTIICTIWQLCFCSSWRKCRANCPSYLMGKLFALPFLATLRIVRQNFGLCFCRLHFPRLFSGIAVLDVNKVFRACIILWFLYNESNYYKTSAFNCKLYVFTGT